MRRILGSSYRPWTLIGRTASKCTSTSLPETPELNTCTFIGRMLVLAVRISAIGSS
jgi:hypothetical protein